MPFPAPFFVALTIMVRLFLHSLKQMMKQIHKKPSLMVQMLDRPKKKQGPQRVIYRPLVPSACGARRFEILISITNRRTKA